MGINLDIGGRVRKFSSIEHTAGSYNLLSLENRHERLSINIAKKYLDQQELLATQPLPSPIFLIVNDQNVLSKIVSRSDTLAQAANKAFPQASASEFYMEMFNFSDGCHVSICRKDVVDDIVAWYANNGIDIVGFSLGNNLISQLSGIHTGDQVSSSNCQAVFHQGDISNIDLSEKVIGSSNEINGLSIDSDVTLGLCSSLSLLRSTSTVYNNFHDINTQYQSAVRSKQIGRQILKVGLLTALIILAVNFFTFEYFRSESSRLASEIELLTTSSNSFEQLQKEIDEKEQIIHQINSNRSSKASWYIDQVGSTVPKGVVLSSVSYQPIQGKLQENKLIEFREQSIDISGKILRTGKYESWLKKLEKLPWVTSVHILNYGVPKNSEVEFDIRLLL